MVLRGELDLISTEEISRRLLGWAADETDPSTIHLDVTGVTRSRTAAGRLMLILSRALEERGTEIEFEGTLG